MTLTIKIDMDNAAFESDPDEIGRILMDLSGRLPFPPTTHAAPINLYDINGNHVGSAKVS